jgi:2-aminoethylphosphonate-pyruvate transaminase
MITRALILAAGRGVAIGNAAEPNCLTPVGGLTLIQRTLERLVGAGIQRIGIVVGYGGAALRQHLAGSPRVTAATRGRLAFFENPDWDGPNGLSVLAARSFVAERTLLVMSDQIAAPALLRELCALSAARGPTVLAVDLDLARVFDIDDATKVKLTPTASASRVTDIGKTLAEYDGISAGLFVMSPSLVDTLAALPRPSLTDGVAAAARAGLVEAHDVGGKLWQDVDSPEMKLHAEWLLRVYGEGLAAPSMPADNARGGDPSGTLALIERLLAEKDQPGHVLFSPGPVMTSARVKAALVHHDVCHRDADYSGVVERLQQKLRPVFRATDAHEMLLITGSGTAAMEMSIASVVPPGKKLLVIANGAFGDRLEEVGALHGISMRALRYPWGALPDPRDVARAFESDPDIAAAALIHHETSVGLLNPVGEIGRLCRARGVTLVVDAVSALGAEDVDVVRDGIDICYSSANKCLHSVSGVSFLCIAPEVWPRIAAIPPRVYYLDLARHRRYLGELRQTPFTPAVSSFFALETALDELAERGGVPARRELYRRRNLRIRRVFADLGFSSFTNTGRESHTISMLRLPDGLTVDALYDGMKARGFIIYKAKGDLAERHIQIANMGELSDPTIDAFLGAVAGVVGERRAADPASARAALKSR